MRNAGIFMQRIWHTIRLHYFSWFFKSLFDYLICSIAFCMMINVQKFIVIHGFVFAYFLPTMLNSWFFWNRPIWIWELVDFFLEYLWRNSIIKGVKISCSKIVVLNSKIGIRMIRVYVPGHIVNFWWIDIFAQPLRTILVGIFTGETCVRK